jgi:hypothetical protein
MRSQLQLGLGGRITVCCAKWESDTWPASVDAVLSSGYCRRSIGATAKWVMTNSFGIPQHIETEIRARDSVCVYCRGEMKAHIGERGTPRDKATIEHLSFDGPFRWRYGLQREDIVICCCSCNASRGKKRLNEWFRSGYCIERGINESTVAEPVRYFLRRFPGK